MSENNFQQWKEKRKFAQAEFNRRYGRYYIVYIALIGTGILSAVTGLLIPASQGEKTFGVITLLAGLYFAVGFLTNGEIAANYWFGKLTDHDPDSLPQQIIAVVSLGISIIVSLVTALASSILIAYWLNLFPEFSGIPNWAQIWVVDIIPVMWVFHAVAGMSFKGLSEEAQMERLSKQFVRGKQNELHEAKENAKVNWWKQNAEHVYREEGEREAQADLNTRFNRVYAKDTGNPQKGEREK